MSISTVTSRDYVCPYCFQQPHNCQCKKYSSELLHVDEEIQPCIQVLNAKGYVTRYCCSRHIEEYRKYNFSELYVFIVDWVDIGTNYPEGFVVDKQKISCDTIM